MTPVEIAAIACLVVSGVCWLLSVVTHEHSWVDRLWSITPIGYVAWFAHVGGWSARGILLTTLVLAWGVRLTFNFARKGGYAKGGEDYRWLELKKRMSPLAFAAFNVLFVALFQNVLLLGITLPAHAAIATAAPLGPIDVALALVFALLLALETVADEQQWRFQTAKRAAVARGEAHPPFLTTGLFRWSRHPNFFAEQAMWCVLAVWAIAVGSREWLLVLPGALTLVALFFGSTRVTEELSVRKYPSYADYQRTTSKLIPWPPRA